MITQSEFIKQYCERSKMSEERLNKVGQFCIACDCGEGGCEGWVFTSRENVKMHIDLYLEIPK